jgi:two-component system invasion response regulator UvrY
MTTIQLVVVDDHRITLAGIQYALKGAEDIVVVAQTDSGQQAIELIAQHKPHVALLDIELPDISGLEIAKRLKQRNSQTRILILSGHVEPQYIHEAALRVENEAG